MPRGQKIGRCAAQGLLLVVEDLERKSGIQLRVVDTPAFELSVLVMLDQVVVGVARVSQRIESECVDRWQPQ